MAVLLIDGFDRYKEGSGVGSFSSVWSYGGLEQDPVRMVPGRFAGSQAVSLGTVGRDYFSYRFLPGYRMQATIGAAVKLTQAGFRTLLGLGVDGDEGLSLVRTHIGQMQVRLGRGGGDSPAIATSDAVDLLTKDGWHYVEMAATCGPSGNVRVWVNGELVIDATGVATQRHNQAGWNSFGLGMNDTYRHYDDFYVADSFGEVGEVRVDTLDPIANTSIADFAPVGTDAGWKAVSEAMPDADATHIASNTLGARSQFELEDASSSIQDVIAVQVRGYAAKLDAGTRAVRYVVASGAAEAKGREHFLATSYTHSFDVHDRNPLTDAPWTPAAIDALRVGVEVTT